MLLDEFITETLVQVTKGVTNAAPKIKELGGEVNRAPVGSFGKYDPEQQLIKFDIALEVKESSTKDASGKAKLSVLSFGGGITNADETSTAHRIEFSVPLSLPSDMTPI